MPKTAYTVCSPPLIDSLSSKLLYSMARFIFLVVFLGTFLPSFAQYEMDFLGMDTLDNKKKCVFPILYFKEGTTELEYSYDEQLSYIAFMLHLNPEMSVRLSAENLSPRFQNKQRKLNTKRIKLIARNLHKDYGIPKRRIVKIPYRPWAYRAANAPKPHALLERRVICEAIW